MRLSGCAYQTTVQQRYLTKDEIAERNRQNLGGLEFGMKHVRPIGHSGGGQHRRGSGTGRKSMKGRIRMVLSVIRKTFSYE